MARLFLYCIPITFFFFFTEKKSQKWHHLFNGKDLKGWDSYLDYETDSFGKPVSPTKLGFNNDRLKVFSVVIENELPAIRVSGKIWGGLSTVEEFSDYHLQLQFKWGNTANWGHKRGKKKDSGLLYHGTGEHGANNEPWLKSQEFQIEENNTGDYWGVAGAGVEINTINTVGRKYIYNPTGTVTTFSQSSYAGRHCEKIVDAEYPIGQWNTLDLYCLKGISVHVVNGKTVMVLKNSFQEKDGLKKPLTSGKLQLQSEGAELFYRNIRIRSISEIPPEILN